MQYTHNHYNRVCAEQNTIKLNKPKIHVYTTTLPVVYSSLTYSCKHWIMNTTSVNGFLIPNGSKHILDAQAPSNPVKV